MGQDPALGRFYTTREVALILRVPLSTIRYWIWLGKLESVKPGRSRLISQSEVSRLLERKRRRVRHGGPVNRFQ